MTNKGFHHTEATKQKMREKRLSEETKQKIRESLKLVKRTEEWNRKNSIAHKGKRLTGEHKRHLSEARKKLFLENPQARINLSNSKKGKPSPQRGAKRSEETIIKIKESRLYLKIPENNPMWGKHHTEETKRKIGEANKGRGHNHTEETKRKISNKNKGRPVSEENKKKMRLAKLGKTLSEEHKAKLKIAQSGKHVGCNNAMFGTHLSEERKKQLSILFSGRCFSEETRMKQSIAAIESKRGIWYGSVTYDCVPQYCEKWKDVNKRVHAFFNHECCLCHAKENGKAHMGHHVFYVKEACCWYNEDGVYYTNLNAPDHDVKDYCIGENPNYFVLLCSKCHGKTNGNYSNRKKWADFFKDMIDNKYDGKCYLTKEEYKKYLLDQKSSSPVI